MKSFKFVCDRDNQRSEFIVSYPSIEEAKSDIHKQGYTVVEAREVTEARTSSAHIFYFETEINGQKKVGQIEGDDIFKCFVKLVEVHKYKIGCIYDQRATDEEKKLTTKKVQELYEIYQKQKSTEKSDKPQTSKIAEPDPINQSILREIQRYQAIIDRIIARVDSMTTGYADVLSPDDRSRLSYLYDGLKQSRGLMNADRLKIIGEESLVKLSDIEMALIEARKIERKKGYFRDTNALLHELGSGHKIRFSDEKFNFSPVKFLSDAYSDFRKTLRDRKIGGLDRKSGLYFKVIREKRIYEKKLRDTVRPLVRSYLRFDEGERRRIAIRRKLIRQNILLLEHRLRQGPTPFSKIVRGRLDRYSGTVVEWVRTFGDTVIMAFAIYGVVFVLTRTITQLVSPASFSFNMNALYTLSFFAFIGLASRFVKNFTMLIVVATIYLIFMLFLQVNF